MAGVDKKQQPYLIHPGSNVKMVGFQLPNFNKLKQFILEISQKVPQARFAGWDIAITPEGYDLVEINCPGGHDILQPFGVPYGDLLKRELTWPLVSRELIRSEYDWFIFIMFNVSMFLYKFRQRSDKNKGIVKRFEI